MSIEKGKSSKKIKFEYIVIVILVVLALVIFFTSSNINLTIKKTSKNSENSTFYNIEAKLNSVLENIDGVGKVDLIISYKSSNQKDYLTNTDLKNMYRDCYHLFYNGKNYIYNLISSLDF